MRLLSVLVLVAFLSACQTSDNYGSGPLTLSPNQQAFYQKYKRVPTSLKWFLITDDRKRVYYRYCEDYAGCQMSPSYAVQTCETQYGQPCKIYAEANDIVWRFSGQPNAAVQSGGQRSQYPPGIPKKDRALQGLQRYLSESGFKAFVSTGPKNGAGKPWSFGFGSRKSTIQQAIDRAFEICKDRSAKYTGIEPCRLNYIGDENVTGKDPSQFTAIAKTTGTVKRPIALNWEGQSELIAGTVSVSGSNSEGVISADLPNGAGTCKGTYTQAPSKDGGVWSMSCTNGKAASGTYKTTHNGRGAIGSGTDTDGRKVKFTISGDS